MRKAVLVAMADRANDDGSGIYVSKSRIAAELECSRETVRQAAIDLEADGLLATVGKKAGRRGYTVIYQISVRNIQLLPDAWATCPDLGTLDSDLGEDEIDGDKVPSRKAVSTAKVPRSSPQSANVIGKNRPYRTIENNPSEFKTSASHSKKSPSDEAALMLWEAQRVRASGDHERANDMEERAEAMMIAHAKAERDRVKADQGTEH